MTEYQTLERPGTTPIFDKCSRTTELIIGARPLQKLDPALQQLRRQCSQQDEMVTDPRYFIATNAQRNRRVAAVLIRKEGELEACVLFFEHCRWGIGLGIWRGGDPVGDGLVLGAQCFRVHYIHLAAKALLSHWRIHGVSLAVGAPLEHCLEAMGNDNPWRILSTRSVERKLNLPATYEEMLAGFGPRTRRSLSAKRRQLERQAQVIFVPSLLPAQASAVMLELQARSAPFRPAKFYHARKRLLCQYPETFCMGIRTPDGKWLSVLSGWRRNKITYVDLQMNDKYLKKESLSAVMRAYMLEHEILARQVLIHFVGGTSLLLKRYCRPSEPCVDIFLWRPCLRSNLFRALVPRLMEESVYARIRSGSTGLTLTESDQC